MRRADGSIRSSNIPSNLSASRLEIDYGTYRCMVIESYYIDNDRNVTFSNRQVTYDCLILGGYEDGQIIPNAKLVNYLGGQYNYHERVLRKSEKPFSGEGKVNSSNQKGDIVYVQYVGKTSNPIIIGLGTHFLDKDTTGATKEDGHRWVEEYNGVNTHINRTGEWEFVRKGGVLNTEKGYFIPADRSIEEEDGEASEELFQARLKFSDNIMLWEDPASSIEFKKTEKLLTRTVGRDLDAEGNEQGPAAYTEVIDGAAEKATITFKSGLILSIDGVGDKVDIVTKGGASISVDGVTGTIEAKDNGTGKLKISDDKVALGASSAELLEQISASLGKLVTMITSMETETHTGNLGYATSVPINAAAYTTAKTELSTIKGLVDGIKGTL